MPDALQTIVDRLRSQLPDADPVLLAEALWLAALRGGEPDEPEFEPARPPESQLSANPSAPAPPTMPARRRTPLELSERVRADHPVYDARPAPQEDDRPPALGGRSGSPVRLRPARALPKALEIGRALRPLRMRWQRGRRQELDVAETVRSYVRTGDLLPAFRPAPERWFDVAVVIDTAPGMAVWDAVLTEFLKVLKQVGAFRTVRRWSASFDGRVATLRDDHGRAAALRQLHASDSRRLILVVSDCVDSAARPDALWAALRYWGRSTPTALVNPLPTTMWRRTGLGLPAVQARPTAVAAQNTRLRFRLPLLLDDGDWLPVPVATLTPHMMGRLAWTIMNADPDGCDAVLVPFRSRRPPGAAKPRTPPSGDQLVDLFGRSASSAAAKLAVLCAPHSQVSLPLLNLIRQRMVPEASAADVAETVVGGLFERPGLEHGVLVLRFRPGVRERLAELLSLRDAWTMFDTLTQYIADHLDPSADPAALLGSGVGLSQVPPELRPFALARREVLRFLGDVPERVPLGGPPLAEPSAGPAGRQASDPSSAARGAVDSPTSRTKAQPRQHILDTWRALGQVSLVEGDWRWSGPVGRNSVDDAAQLLCLIHPGSRVADLRLDALDEADEEVQTALDGFGGATGAPRLIVRLLLDYLRNYQDESNNPTFAGGQRFAVPDSTTAPSEDQLALPVVDSFGHSITLMLDALALVQGLLTREVEPAWRTELQELSALAARRLTAALVGLLRSFAVNAFYPDSPDGQLFLRALNQTAAPSYALEEGIKEKLMLVRAGLRDLTIGSGQADLDNPNLLFECGWAWGLVRDAPQIDAIRSGPILQPAGVADPRPSLHFTLSALAAIAGLSSRRTRVLGLLDEEHQRLANALELRASHTRQYWTTLATFGTGRWPLEDLPWRASDSTESDYYTLLVSAIALQAADRPGPAVDLNRIGGVLGELAQRSGVNRRLPDRGPGTDLHSPGVRLPLAGSEALGPTTLTWTATGFAPLLLQQALAAAVRAPDGPRRAELTALVEQAWDHLSRRQLTTPPGTDLWDQPSNVFPQLPEERSVSWQQTQRVVDALAEMAAATFEPAPSDRVQVSRATAILTTVDLRLGRELPYLDDQATDANGGTELGRIRAKLNRARALEYEDADTAAGLATEILAELAEKARRRDP